MSRTYEMKHESNEAHLTVTRFDGKSFKTRTYEPSAPSRDRLTRVVNQAAREQRNEHDFSLLYSEEGFGWRLTVYRVRPCVCGKPIYEYDRARYDGNGVCLDCKVAAKVAADLALIGARQAA